MKHFHSGRASRKKITKFLIEGLARQNCVCVCVCVRVCVCHNLLFRFHFKSQKNETVYNI